MAEKNKSDSGSPKKKLVPDNTSILMSVKYNFEKGYPELVLSTKNSAFIHGVVARSTKLFEKDAVSLYVLLDLHSFDRKEGEDGFTLPIISDVYAETVLKLAVYIGNSVASKELGVDTSPDLRCKTVR